MIIRQAPDLHGSEITPRSAYVSRRGLMVGALALAALPSTVRRAEAALPNVAKSPFVLDDKRTPLEDITHYNNFYEFGMDKDQPAKRAPGRLRTRPWTVRVEGECGKPGTFDVDDFIRRSAL